jgi:hypothetical protein
MPIQLQVSPLHRLIVLVARGHLTPDDVKEAAEKVTQTGVRHYGKIIDISDATAELSVEQVQRIAASLRGSSDGASVLRGPLAFVVDPNRRGFGHDFAEATEEDRPIKLFRSLHDARKWLQQTMDEEQQRGGRMARATRPQTPPT